MLKEMVVDFYGSKVVKERMGCGPRLYVKLVTIFHWKLFWLWVYTWA